MITNTDHKAGLKITFPAAGRIRAEVPVILQDRRDARGRSLWYRLRRPSFCFAAQPAVVRSVTMPQALRSVLPGPTAMSRSRTPGSRAMRSSTRAWLVRTLQLVTLKNGRHF